jgi:flagellar biosynthesis/type III secretory pathway M-ring protein FliF/YscJ
LPAISVMLIFIVLLMMYMWIDGGEYRTLYPDMSEVDRSESMQGLLGYRRTVSASGQVLRRPHGAGLIGIAQRCQYRLPGILQ